VEIELAYFVMTSIDCRLSIIGKDDRDGGGLKHAMYLGREKIWIDN
jgi:hypothetical protein